MAARILAIRKIVSKNIVKYNTPSMQLLHHTETISLLLSANFLVIHVFWDTPITSTLSRQIVSVQIFIYNAAII